MRWGLSTILLLLVNVIFLGVGGMLIYLSQKTDSAGWIEAIKDTDSDVEFALETAAKVVLGIGIAVIILSLGGIVGALFGTKCILLAYASFMGLIVVVCAVFTGAAFVYNNRLMDWEDKSYPASDEEKNMTTAFNQVYCYAQGEYFCNEATMKEITSVFLSTSDAALAEIAFPDVTGIIDFCKTESKTGKLFQNLNKLMDNDFEDFDHVCGMCNNTAKYDEYKQIREWTEDSCSATESSRAWCARFLVNGGENMGNNATNITGSPYKSCREQFLDEAIDGTEKLVFGGVAATIIAFILVVATCVSMRKMSKEGVNDEFQPTTKGAV